MKIQLGFSGEVGTNKWRKGDIELDEVDLQRMLRDRDLNIDVTDLSVIQAFTLLESETTRLLWAEMLSLGAAGAEATARIQDANARIEKVIAELQ